MVNRSDGSHDLYVGAALRQLNEYVVVKSPTKNTVYGRDGRPQVQQPPRQRLPLRG
jgi:hypothetical protein